jgi:hypothetical protein
VEKPRPAPPCSFEAWLDAQQFPSPQTPREEELQRMFVIGMHIAWDAGFAAGLVAHERDGGHAFPPTPKENTHA